jgi:hypothetical protein
MRSTLQENEHTVTPENTRMVSLSPSLRTMECHFPGDLDDQILILHIADHGREMLDGLDGAVRDELDAPAHLQVHGLEFEVLGLGCRGGLVACHAMLIVMGSKCSMHDFLIKKHLYQ